MAAKKNQNDFRGEKICFHSFIRKPGICKTIWKKSIKKNPKQKKSIKQNKKINSYPIKKILLKNSIKIHENKKLHKKCETMWTEPSCVAREIR